MIRHVFARVFVLGIGTSCAMIGVSAPIFAAPLIVLGRNTTFRGFEHELSGRDRIAAANSYFRAVIPVGSAVVNARALLKRAGAWCSDRDPAQLRCTANSSEAVEDMLHDVSWTVNVEHMDAKVTHVAVDRSSIGS
jgi:hypothetical protein